MFNKNACKKNAVAYNRTTTNEEIIKNSKQISDARDTLILLLSQTKQDLAEQKTVANTSPATQPWARLTYTPKNDTTSIAPNLNTASPKKAPAAPCGRPGTPATPKTTWLIRLATLGCQGFFLYKSYHSTSLQSLCAWGTAAVLASFAHASSWAILK